jgi:hypothetical protein
MLEKIFKILSSDPEIVYDSSSVDISTFEWKEGYYTHKISQREIEKPYLISLQYYGMVDYEDIILWLNNIPYVFDMIVETELRIPKLADLKKFILDHTQ